MDRNHKSNKYKSPKESKEEHLYNKKHCDIRNQKEEQKPIDEIAYRRGIQRARKYPKKQISRQKQVIIKLPFADHSRYPAIPIEEYMHDGEDEDKDTDERNKLLKTHPSDGRELLEEKVPDREEKAVIEDHEDHEHKEARPVLHRREEVVFVEGEECFHGSSNGN